MAYIKDLTGQTFGSLTIICKDPDRSSHWLCSCRCGNITSARRDNILAGYTRTCGCRQFTPSVQRGTMTYNSVHQRLRKIRGRAADHICVDCDAPAYDWSLDEEPTHITPGGRGYSTSLDAYSPRCRSCHYALDRKISA